MPLDVLNDSFRAACNDVLFLYERKYPRKQVVTLAGNRYRLDSLQRSVLSRGVVPAALAGERKSKLVPSQDIAGRCFSVDSCNVVATVGNYLSGYFTYIACDDIVRDAAEAQGVFRHDELRRQAVKMIVASVAELQPEGILFIIDEPHPHSRDLAGEIRKQLAMAGFSGAIELVKSADRVLKDRTDILVTGDSEIIDAVQYCFDLSRYVLETKFNAELPNLNEFIEIY